MLMDLSSRRHRDLEVGQGDVEAKEGSAELLRAGVMGNAWELRVTDMTRRTGHVGLSPDDVRGRLLW